MKENRKLLKEVLKDIRHDMSDEEVLNLLADSKISVSPESEKEKYTLGQRAADVIAKFAGSWAFIFSFTGVLVLWMIVNTLLAAKAFDPYPFILLNLVLSCVAAIQAPLIMMSQNRQEEKDRRRAENDYKVNLKTEIMIEDLSCIVENGTVRFCYDLFQRSIFKLGSRDQVIQIVDISLKVFSVMELNSFFTYNRFQRIGCIGQLD
jgi:uncharacterized membrane protein